MEDAEALRALKVGDLKDRLRQAKLPVGGNKEQLISQLLEARAAGNATATEKGGDVTATGKDGDATATGKDGDATATGKDGDADNVDNLVAQLDAQADQIGEILESRLDEIDNHWQQTGAAGERAASSPAAVASDDQAPAPVEDDLIAALEAQAEQISSILESRLDEIDTHWRQSGGKKPGAIAKSLGAAAKAPPGNAASLGAAAKAPPGNAASLGAAAKAPPAASLGAAAKAPPAKSLGALPKGAPLATPLSDASPPPLPPWRLKSVLAQVLVDAQLPYKAPPKPGTLQIKSASQAVPHEVEDEDEAEYDPFSEAPLPEVADTVADTGFGAHFEQLVRAAQAECQKSRDTLQAVRQGLLDDLMPPLVPPASGVTLADMKSGLQQQGTAQAQDPATALMAAKQAALKAVEAVLAGQTLDPKAAAASWFRRSAAKRRMDEGAQLAKEYFAQRAAPNGVAKAAQPPAKRKRVETKKDVFARALMDKAPPSLQTCRSLLAFLEKKLAGKPEAAPDISGPQDLRLRLLKYAQTTGRVSALRVTSGWDARAKRVLDIADCAASKRGQDILSDADEKMQALASELAKALKERGEHDLAACTDKRREWEKEAVRQGWFSWCARLLRAKEAALLAEDTATSEVSATAVAGEIGAIDVLQALVSGTVAPAAS